MGSDGTLIIGGRQLIRLGSWNPQHMEAVKAMCVDHLAAGRAAVTLPPSCRCVTFLHSRIQKQNKPSIAGLQGQ